MDSRRRSIDLATRAFIRHQHFELTSSSAAETKVRPPSSFPVIQPSLEDLLRPETEDEDALSLADFDDEQ